MSVQKQHTIPRPPNMENKLLINLRFVGLSTMGSIFKLKWVPSKENHVSNFDVVHFFSNHHPHLLVEV